MLSAGGRGANTNPHVAWRHGGLRFLVMSRCGRQTDDIQVGTNLLLDTLLSYLNGLIANRPMRSCLN